jgi:hypothetical protein
MTMPRRSAAGLLAALALSLFFVPAPSRIERAAAGDAKVAETLFKSGKQALGKGDCPGAVTYFTKALEESPDLIEAAWWKGSAQEKSGDKGAALASYREYLALYDGKFSSGATVSKEEQRLKGLAEKSVDSMAAGEKDYKKLEDAYVAALFQFAKDNFVRDPGISLKATEQLLLVRPDHAEAQKLHDKLGGAGGAAGESEQKGPPKATGPFGDVKEWKNYVGDKLFKNDGISYSGDLMFVDAKGGMGASPPNFVDYGKDFAIEGEFRVPIVYDRGWMTGLGFGAKNGNYMSTLVTVGRVALVRWQGEQHNEVATFDMAPLDTKTWHHVGAAVRGPAIEVWFDGKKVITWQEPSGSDFPGDVVVMQQTCKTDWRLFRAGKFE